MNKKQFQNNDLFSKAVQMDNPSIIPDPAIDKRINYYFNLQHSRQKIHSNSFSGIFGWIFSSNALVFKAGFAVLTFVFLFIKSPVMENNSVITSDTCASKSVLVDTGFVVRDTCVY